MFCTHLIPSTNFGWDMVWKMKSEEKLGYFSIKNIDDPCVVTAAVDFKEYFHEFESQAINKKHEGLRKGVSGLEF